MKKIYYLLLFTITLWSCEQKHLWEKLCDCYTQLHRAQEKEEQLFGQTHVMFCILKY